MSQTNSFIDRPDSQIQQQPGTQLPSAMPDNSSLDGLDLVPIDELELSARNDNNVVSLTKDQKKFTNYKIDKLLPTLNSEALDDILDDEWDFYIDPSRRSTPRQDGLFLINLEISLNPPDFHNEYIQRGPANIDDRINGGEDEDTVVKTTFCVFFVQNNVALPIPNYKTLEVMLVERDKTYSAIQEATPEQVKLFDLEIDGIFTADNDGSINPIEEFRFRQMLDRSASWNERVRFNSGYRPGFDSNSVPFKRDPGDYLLPPNNRVSGLYNPLVYQTQTFREKLREQYEGKLIALQWPVSYPSGSLNDPDFNITLQELGNSLTAPNSVIADDKVFFVRMMINGYWKQVVSLNVFRQYALLNNFDLSKINLDQNSYGPLENQLFTQLIVPASGANLSDFINIPKAGLYGINGIINILKDSGGIDVIQNYNITNNDLDSARNAIIGLFTVLNTFGGGTTDSDGNLITASGNIFITRDELDNVADSFTAEVKSPAWSDFSHIIEADRLDPAEYEDYINNYSNGGDPFGIEYLQPYEPAGSIKYYDPIQLSRLQQQANTQASIDSIKKQIQEMLPELSARAAELDQRFKAQPANYLNYVYANIGPNSDIYSVLFSDDKFKIGKKKSSGKIKEKNTDTSFMRLIEKRAQFFGKLDKDEEDEIFYKPGSRDFTRLVERNDSILNKLVEYLNTGAKKLFPQAWIEIVPGGADAVASAAALGGGAAAALTGTAVAVGALAGGLAVALAPLAITAGVVALAGAGLSAVLFDLDLTPRGLPRRHGMPRSTAGTRRDKLMKQPTYIKTMIATYIYREFVKSSASGLINESGAPVDIFDKAAEIDNTFFLYRGDIDNALVTLKDIDSRLVTSSTEAAFLQIFADLQQIEIDFNNIDLTIFEQGESLKKKIDDFVKYMIKQQYDSIQYCRNKLWNKKTFLYNKKKYFIAWPEDAKETIQAYFPGKVFDNHQPDDFDGDFD